MASEGKPLPSAAGAAAPASEDMPFVVAAVAFAASFVVAFVALFAWVPFPVEPVAFSEAPASVSVVGSAPPAFAAAILLPAGSSVDLAAQLSALLLQYQGYLAMLAANLSAVTWSSDPLDSSQS